MPTFNTQYELAGMKQDWALSNAERSQLHTRQYSWRKAPKFGKTMHDKGWLRFKHADKKVPMKCGSRQLRVGRRGRQMWREPERAAGGLRERGGAMHGESRRRHRLRRPPQPSTATATPRRRLVIGEITVPTTGGDKNREKTRALRRRGASKVVAGDAGCRR